MSQKAEENEQKPVHLLSDCLKIAGIAIVVFMISSHYLPEIDDEILKRTKRPPSSWHERSDSKKDVIAAPGESGLLTDSATVQ